MNSEDFKHSSYNKISGEWRSVCDTEALYWILRNQERILNKIDALERELKDIQYKIK